MHSRCTQVDLTSHPIHPVGDEPCSSWTDPVEKPTGSNVRFLGLFGSIPVSNLPFDRVRFRVERRNPPKRVWTDVARSVGTTPWTHVAPIRMRAASRIATVTVGPLRRLAPVHRACDVPRIAWVGNRATRVRLDAAPPRLDRTWTVADAVFLRSFRDLFPRGPPPPPPVALRRIDTFVSSHRIFWMDRIEISFRGWTWTNGWVL
mmetsp:Transcript_2028/g.13043  ORF Transcript_2028/g.13043 Transcript_2028/m.13043 type:complete len:204 (+) Transcript_2028:976-1587(+)